MMRLGFCLLLLCSVFCLLSPIPTAQAPPDLRAAAAALPDLRSLLVSSHGRLTFEYYGGGTRPGALANVKSASKSIISTLVGIAIERKLIPSVEEPIATYFPELRKDSDRRKHAITVEDLLTMRSGLESTSGSNYGSWVRSSNWVRHVLRQPIVSTPGTAMAYSTGTSHLLSAILTKTSGTSTWQFAQDTLATPLGMRLARWPRDPQGIYFGGNEMLMTPKQMLTLGELYLNRGRAGGRQIVPAAWVETSCVPRTTSVWDHERHYGYGWWIQAFQGGTACFAWGYGGQYIFVFRDLGLVVVATSSTTVSEERRGHRRRLFDLIEQHVLAPASPVRPAGSRRRLVHAPSPRVIGDLDNLGDLTIELE
jgi:CubicO group peptidase (beta-lactamase class C family)